MTNDELEPDEPELVSIVVVGTAVVVVRSTVAADAESDPVDPTVVVPLGRAWRASTPARPTVEAIATPVATRRARAAG